MGFSEAGHSAKRLAAVPVAGIAIAPKARSRAHCSRQVPIQVSRCCPPTLPRAQVPIHVPGSDGIEADMSFGQPVWTRGFGCR